MTKRFRTQLQTYTSKYPMIGIVMLFVCTLFLSVRLASVVYGVCEKQTTNYIQALQKESQLLETETKDKQQKEQEQKEQIKGLLSQVMPQTFSTGHAVEVLDKIALAPSKGIQIKDISFLSNEIQKKDGYTVYPCRVSFTANKEPLFSMMEKIAQSTILKDNKNILALPDGERMVMPIMVIKEWTIDGDLSDRYDTTGTLLQPSVTATLLLHFYSQI